MYPHFTHCHSHVLKIVFLCVIWVNANFLSLQKSILQDSPTAAEEQAGVCCHVWGRSCWHRRVSEHPGHKSQLCQQLPLSPLLDRFFPSTWFFNEKTDLFPFQVDYFCWIISGWGSSLDQATPTPPQTGTGRGRQVRMTSGFDLLNWTA